jgi:hypothetical protein
MSFTDEPAISGRELTSGEYSEKRKITMTITNEETAGKYALGKLKCLLAETVYCRIKATVLIWLCSKKPVPIS